MRGVPLGRVRGVAVEAHWSLVFIALYLPVVCAPLLRGWFPELSTSTITALSLATAPIVIASIALHELGHMFQARREGMPAERTILWAFGGLAFTGGFARSPAADFRITAAGPLVSLVLAVLFGSLAWLAGSAGVATWLVALLWIVCVDNALSLVFNLAPAYPLDGGRMLHEALWHLRGFSWASRWTTPIGLAVGGLVIFIGAAGPFLGLFDAAFTGAGGTRRGIDAFSIMFAGVILASMAYAIRPPSELRRLTLRARAVGDLLQPTPVMPAPGTSVSGFLDRLVREGGQSAAVYPVVEDGRVLGVISAGVAAAARDDDPATDVAEVMVRKEDAVVLRPEMTIREAFEAFRDDSSPAVVIHEDLVVGILRKSDLAAALLAEKEARHGPIVKAERERESVDW
jgi:Zn-dependent protease/CBS domain-containing protein